MIPYQLLENYPFIEELSNKASGEALIEFQIQNIENKWSELSFIVLPYSD